MHYVLPFVFRCFTLGQWSGAKNMMSCCWEKCQQEMFLQQRKEVPLLTDRGVSRERGYHTRKGWIRAETADDIRKKAMESLKELKKRNSDEVVASRKCCKSRRGEPLVDFLREKQRLTAKLDNSSYMQNNRNRKVSSKWWKLWSFSSNKWILHYWLLWESY